MGMFDNPQFARQVIMDHYENPRNKRIETGYYRKRMDSASCIDDITVYANIDNGVIQDICFDGIGCTVSTASTSMMTELVVGKTVEEAYKIMHEYMKMVNLQSFDEDVLREAVVFRNVGKQANRVNCATLGWRGLGHILNESEGYDE